MVVPRVLAFLIIVLRLLTEGTRPYRGAQGTGRHRVLLQLGEQIAVQREKGDRRVHLALRAHPYCRGCRHLRPPWWHTLHRERSRRPLCAQGCTGGGGGGGGRADKAAIDLVGGRVRRMVHDRTVLASGPGFDAFRDVREEGGLLSLRGRGALFIVFIACYRSGLGRNVHGSARGGEARRLGERAGGSEAREACGSRVCGERGHGGLRCKDGARGDRRGWLRLAGVGGAKDLGWYGDTRSLAYEKRWTQGIDLA